MDDVLQVAANSSKSTESSLHGLEHMQSLNMPKYNGADIFHLGHKYTKSAWKGKDDNLSHLVQNFVNTYYDQKEPRVWTCT